MIVRTVSDTCVFDCTFVIIRNNSSESSLYAAVKMNVIMLG